MSKVTVVRGRYALLQDGGTPFLGLGSGNAAYEDAPLFTLEQAELEAKRLGDPVANPQNRIGRWSSGANVANVGTAMKDPGNLEVDGSGSPVARANAAIAAWLALSTPAISATSNVATANVTVTNDCPDPVPVGVNTITFTGVHAVSAVTRKLQRTITIL